MRNAVAGQRNKEGHCPFFHKMKAKNEKYANYELKNLTFQHYGNKIYI